MPGSCSPCLASLMDIARSERPAKQARRWHPEAVSLGFMPESFSICLQESLSPPLPSNPDPIKPQNPLKQASSCQGTDKQFINAVLHRLSPHLLLAKLIFVCQMIPVWAKQRNELALQGTNRVVTSPVSTRQAESPKQVLDSRPHGIPALGINQEAAVPDAHLQRPASPLSYKTRD